MKTRFYFLLFGGFMCTVYCYARNTADSIALTGVSIIDANHPIPLAAQTVIISGGKIKAVFRDGSKNIPPGYTVFALTGKYLLPGLIDSHVHMATDPSGTDNRSHTLEVLEKMLQTGVTTVRDMAGDARTLAGIARDAKTGDIVSPDIYYSALMAGPSFFSDPRTASSTQGGEAGNMPYMLAVTDSTDLKLAIAAAKGTGATGIKLYANLYPSLVKKIIDEAHAQNMLVWAHASLQNSKPSEIVDAGINSISHVPLLLREKFEKIPDDWKNKPHSAAFWDTATPDLHKLFENMKQKGVILDATLLTYTEWAAGDSTMRYSSQAGKRLTAAAHRAGVLIAAGTDDDQVLFVQAEIKLLVKDAGFSPIDAIIAATLNGAKTLQLEERIGTISVGKNADLLILDKNPLANIDDIETVNMVVKNGRVVKKH